MKLQFTAATEILISSGRTITIPEKVIIIPPKTRVITSVEIISMLDEPAQKRVTVKTKEFGNIALWVGKEYEEIGQWTDQDVIDRIKEIYNII